MKFNEANEICIKFEYGENWRQNKDLVKHVKDNEYFDLNRLANIWEKLEMFPELTKNNNGYHAWFMTEEYPCEYQKVEHEGSGKTIQKAACIATAKAIKEFKS